MRKEQGQRADLLDERVERHQVGHSGAHLEFQSEPAVFAVRPTGGSHAGDVPRVFEPEAHDVVVQRDEPGLVDVGLRRDAEHFFDARVERDLAVGQLHVLSARGESSLVAFVQPHLQRVVEGHDVCLRSVVVAGCIKRCK